MAGRSASPHILVVDDDREIRDLLARFLRRYGLRVSVARDGREMRKLLADWRIDLVVLDLMLPGEDGLALCRWLRSERATPVVMLSALDEEADRIVGLEVGADDYLGKPFNPHELLARIRSVLRRATPAPEPPARRQRRLRFAGWGLDLGRRRLENGRGEAVRLSRGEFDLLVAFAEHPQRVLSREQLLDLAYGREPVPFDRSVDIQVSRLRRKIEDDPRRPELITTVRGGGYLFTPEVERQ